MNETKLTTSALTMRPHHALCALFFEGKGYSPAFIENMTALLANPNQICNHHGLRQPLPGVPRNQGWGLR